MTQVASTPKEIVDMFRHIEEKLILAAGYNSFEHLDEVQESRNNGEKFKYERDSFEARAASTWGRITIARKITPEVLNDISNYANAQRDSAKFQEYVHLHIHMMNRFPELRDIARAREAYSLF